MTGSQCALLQDGDKNPGFSENHFFSFRIPILYFRNFARTVGFVQVLHRTGAEIRRGELVISCLSLWPGEEKLCHGPPDGKCSE